MRWGAGLLVWVNAEVFALANPAFPPSLAVMGMNIGGGDVNRSLTQLPLITPDEIMQLPSDQEIILVEKRFPILCNKLNFLTDKKFQGRRLKPIPLPERIKVVVPEARQYKMKSREDINDELVRKHLLETFAQPNTVAPLTTS